MPPPDARANDSRDWIHHMGDWQLEQEQTMRKGKAGSTSGCARDSASDKPWKLSMHTNPGSTPLHRLFSTENATL